MSAAAGEHLLAIAEREDDGEPKTGRRFIWRSRKATFDPASRFDVFKTHTPRQG
jgi:hypothetical protein